MKKCIVLYKCFFITDIRNVSAWVCVDGCASSGGVMARRSLHHQTEQKDCDCSCNVLSARCSFLKVLSVLTFLSGNENKAI